MGGVGVMKSVWKTGACKWKLGVVIGFTKYSNLTFWILMAVSMNVLYFLNYTQKLSATIIENV